jgi:hypothetical protein
MNTLRFVFILILKFYSAILRDTSVPTDNETPRLNIHIKPQR